MMKASAKVRKKNDICKYFCKNDEKTAQKKPLRVMLEAV